MANQGGNQTRINLTDGLILNKNKCAVTQFSGFKKRNSPYYNGGVAPMYQKSEMGSAISREGGSYSLVSYEDGGIGITGPGIPDVGVKLKGSEYSGCVREDTDYLFSKTEGLNNSDLLQAKDKLGFALAGYFYSYVEIGSNNTLKLYYRNIDGLPARSIQTSITLEPNENTRVVSKVLWVKDLSGVSFINWVVAVVVFQESGTYIYVFKAETMGGESNAEYSLLAEFEYEALTDNWGEVDIFNTFNSSDEMILNFVFGKDLSHTVCCDVTTAAIDDVDAYSLLTNIFGADVPYIGYTNNFYTVIKSSASNTYEVSEVIISYDGSDFVVTDNSVIKTLNNINSLDNIEDIKTSYLSAIVGTVYSTLLTDTYSIMSYDFENDNFFIGSGKSDDGTLINCKINKTHRGFPYSLLINNNELSGISVGGVLLTPWFDVDTGTSNIGFYIDYDNFFHIVYFSSMKKDFIDIKIIPILAYVSIDEVAKLQIVNDRYLVVNKSGYNGYDLKEKRLIQFASDWNGRAYLGFNSNSVIFDSGDNSSAYNIIGSGKNVSYESDNENTSSLFNPVPLNYSWGGSSGGCVASDELIYEPIDVYIGEAEKNAVYLSTLKNVSVSTNYNSIFVFKNNGKEGTTYPITTDGNILLSPSIFADYYETKLLSDYIKENGIYYNLVYTEGDVVLLYPYGTGVKNAQESFVIQGQRYVIRNSVICSAIISDGLLTVGEGIVNVGALQFIGCLPSAAYFYSPATECLMAFTGDRLLSTVFEATEIEEIICSDYSPNSNALYIASADAVYSLFSTPDGNSFIYKIERSGVTAIKILNDGTVAFNVDDYFYIYSIYPRSSFNKIPVELSTEFYGYGENRVSVIDSWYIRLYSEEAEEGTLILKVESITDGSTESETKTVRINKTDWDSNGFFYFRYQPQIQRGVGVSLAIKSDFTVYDLQASYSPDSTLQLTSKANTSNNANTF